MKPKMTMQTGLKMMGNIQEISGDTIRFIAEDGREMFEIKAGKDGVSIEVRTVENCMVDGDLMQSNINITPVCANLIHLYVRKYIE